MGDAILASTVNTPAEVASHQPSKQERLELIERVAHSELFGRSARLRDFLLYVGRQSLKEDSKDIHEQEVGVQVFGRPASYDCSQDNIVRVNASALRKRIEAYFVSDGVNESLMIEIPRGSYMPIFHRRIPGQMIGAGAVGEESLPNDSVAVASPIRSRSLWLTLSVSLSLLLAIACIALLWQIHTLRQSSDPWDGKPAVAAFWMDFQRSNGKTDIVLPDSSVGISEELTHHTIGIYEYLNHTYMPSISSLNLSTDRKYDLERIFGHNLVTVGDVGAALQILALNPKALPFHLTASRFYTTDSFKRNNVILIGGKKANPWVFLFDEQTNFSLDQDINSLKTYIVNRHPRPGELATYVASNSAQGQVGYCAIEYLPNPSRTGNAIIFAGTNAEATDAAAEFLTSEDHLEKLRATLNTNRFPYFEIVLKTSQLNGASFNSELVAYRTYPRIP